MLLGAHATRRKRLAAPH
jgi:hypothetical protein